MKKIFILLIIIMTITGCNKKALSGDDFIIKLTKENFTVDDALDSYPSGSLLEAYEASNDNYIISYCITEESKQAVYAYNLYKNVINNNLVKDNTSNESIKDNYGKYYAISDSKIYLVSIVDNTYLYVEADKKYTEEILNIIKKIGY